MIAQQSGNNLYILLDLLSIFFNIVSIFVTAILSVGVVALSLQTYRSQKRASLRESIEQIEHALTGNRTKLVPTLEEFEYFPYYRAECKVYLTSYTRPSNLNADFASRPVKDEDIPENKEGYLDALAEVDGLETIAFLTQDGDSS